MPSSKLAARALQVLYAGGIPCAHFMYARSVFGLLPLVGVPRFHECAALQAAPRLASFLTQWHAYAGGQAMPLWCWHWSAMSPPVSVTQDTSPRAICPDALQPLALNVSAASANKRVPCVLSTVILATGDARSTRLLQRINLADFRGRRCTITFDHHCLWLNTCVGAGNLRFFLAFLATHCFLCCYGELVQLPHNDKLARL